MSIKKIHFAIDKTSKAQNSRKILFKNYKNYTPNKSDVIIVIGGDGFMLSALKKYQKYNKPFYGMNRGSFGFLMNKFKTKNLLKAIFKAKPVVISPLEMKTINKANRTRSVIAINEISLLRQSRQTASLRIIYGKSSLIKKLICDGVLVSTPAGSTAYNLSVNGPILSLNSKKIAITPISPFRPRRWKGKIVSSSSLIKIFNLNIKKRPVSVVADNIEVRNIKKVDIKVNNKIKFKLLYDKANSLSNKIKLESLKKINNA
jgi:NAD+ kinase